MTASSFCHWPISHVVWAGLQCGVCLLWTSLAQLKIYGYGGQCAVMACLLLVLRGLHNILHSVILSIIKASILFPCWSLLLFTDIFLTSQFIHNLPRNNWCSPRHMQSVNSRHWKFSTFPFTYCTISQVFFFAAHTSDNLTRSHSFHVSLHVQLHYWAWRWVVGWSFIQHSLFYRVGSAVVSGHYVALEVDCFV